MSRRLAGPVGLQATVAFVPEVMNNGKWSPICAHYFWNNDNGAKTVCTTLGFSGGTHQQTNTKYNTDAMPVGACYAEQDLTSCTGGGNAWGNFEENHGWCKAGTNVGITVTCGAKIDATNAGKNGDVRAADGAVPACIIFCTACQLSAVKISCTPCLYLHTELA